MSREALIEMARRTLAHIEAGTLPQADSIHRVPATHYTDPNRWQLEVERVYRRLPLALATTAELREPGSFRSLEVVGVPVLMVRGGDGVLRAFVNSCSHRGALVEKRPCGSARRFMCPYHGWSYDRNGALVGIFEAEHFGELDRASHGLVPLPTAERAGIVFVILDPDSTLDIDRFLMGYDSMLSHFELGGRHFLKRECFAGPNWKAAYVGYLDFYHLSVLHAQSFGDKFSNKAVYDAWGPHQRVGAVDPAMSTLAEIPEEQWRNQDLAQGVWTLFPGGSIAHFPAGPGVEITMMNQVFPGPSVGEGWTEIAYLASVEPNSEQQVGLESMAELLTRVVRTEDYPTVDGVFRALSSGAQREVLFGRNEEGSQRFHRWLDRLVAAETQSELEALFADIEIHHQA